MSIRVSGFPARLPALQDDRGEGGVGLHGRLRRPTELTTVLPGAVLGPVLTPDNVGTASIIQRMLRGRMRGALGIGLEVVDVRDLVDLTRDSGQEPADPLERRLHAGEVTDVPGNRSVLIGRPYLEVELLLAPERVAETRRPIPICSSRRSVRAGTPRNPDHDGGARRRPGGS